MWSDTRWLKKDIRTKLSEWWSVEEHWLWNKKLFLEFFDSKVRSWKITRNQISGVIRRHIINCVEFFGKKKPTFDELGEDFKDKFTMFLEMTKDYKMNTINKQFTNIKAIVGKAYKLSSTKTWFKNFNTDKEPL